MSTPNPYDQVSANVIVTVGGPLEGNYHSHKVEGYHLVFTLGKGQFKLPLFVNTPLPGTPSGPLPKWPQALSLKPDLSARAN